MVWHRERFACLHTNQFVFTDQLIGMDLGRMSEIAPKTAFAAASPDSRTRLLNAAIDVIRTRGYSATRVEDICAAAGLTKGSFFHHFKSKDEIALAVVEGSR